MTTSLSITLTSKSQDKTAALVFKTAPHNDGSTIRESMSLVKLVARDKPYQFSVYDGQSVEIVEIPDPTYPLVQAGSTDTATPTG